jgi:hypothetical protein
MHATAAGTALDRPPRSSVPSLRIMDYAAADSLEPVSGLCTARTSLRGDGSVTYLPA